MFTTRIAPSPTGDMHLGTARTAYFNWLAAKASGGKFILRIDDTDLERNKESCVQVIYDTLSWLGIEPDVTFRQSERLKRYGELANALVESGSAFVADNGAIILQEFPRHIKIWKDELAGEIPITETNHQQIDRKLVLVRGGDKLGQPTYQFTSTVDDYDYNINYIIRGVDHQTNTPKQIAIWHCLNKTWSNKDNFPKFAHIGLINFKGKKLSKRDNASSMLLYKDAGYDPNAMLNFMLRLGWGPRVDDKTSAILSKSDATRLFLDGGTMRASPAGMDEAKLKWYDKCYKANG